MKYAITLLMLLLCSCQGGSSAPVDEEAVRNLIEQQVAQLSEGIEREDPLLASQSVSELFEMGANVAVRFDEASWVEDNTNGITKFRVFFASVFDKNANIALQLESASFAISGDVATLGVATDFSSLRIDRTPPQNVSAAGSDLLTFERSGGRWLLVRWDEEVPAG